MLFTFACFRITGIINTARIDSSKRGVEYTQIKFIWSRISDLIKNNQKWAKEVYGWRGNPNVGDEKALDYRLLLNNLALIIESAGYSLVLVKELTQLEIAGFITNNPSDKEFYGAYLPLLQGYIESIEDDGTPLFSREAGFKILPYGDLNQLDNLGFAISPYVKGNATGVQNLSEKLRLNIDMSAEAQGGFYITITPKEISSQTGVSINAKFSLEIKYSDFLDKKPISLITVAKTSKLEIDAIKFAFGGDISGDFYLSGGVEKLQATVDLGSDGFLSNFISEPINIFVGDILAKWQSNKGISFEGGNNVAIVTPVHLEFGPFKVSAIGIELRLINETMFICDISGGLKLGPISASVESIGIKAEIHKSNKGVLGEYDLNLGFKPPKGVGIAINANVVKGGGYLYFNFEKEEYIGALQLTINNLISLKAIGLITTRMTDGSKGFSLLMIITAEFGSPIQLGFGFTLSGVGGLLGFNRSMLLQPLAEGVRTGAVNSVMFPTDVVANAPRIISDLQAFFPVHEGIFLIGPMAKLGWGTPNLITLSLGIIIEIPGNIAILGVLKVVLPDEESALLVLQVNFIGAIEFDKKRAWFFASIFESRILFITIEGEMGVLVAWGNDPNFVVSVGGFHPAFSAPPLPFPEPRRLNLSILNTDYARIRVEGYFAVTSNTVQFGANVELFFGFDSVKVEGQLVFDALFRTPPLYFIITISTSLSVQVFGTGLFCIRFQGSLEGTTPWRIAGTGTVSLLFFDIPVDIDHTWGEELETVLLPIKVLRLLVAELEKLENWVALLPDSHSLHVSLRKIDINKAKEKEAEKELVLHPIGALNISQRAIPLDLYLDKVGSQKPEDAHTLTIAASSAGIVKKADLTESFAMGQFKEMDDAKKLSSPAFEPWKAGLSLVASSAQANTSLAVKRVVRYEKVIIDTNYKRLVRPMFVWMGNLFTVFLNGNAVSKSLQSQRYRNQKQPFVEKVMIQPHVWVVASNSDNSAFAGATGFTSQAKAYEYMQQQIRLNPELADSVHVIPQAESRRAA
ncbi:MAG: DUF6603 domain-containing protein [Methylococcales bacterium]